MTSEVNEGTAGQLRVRAVVRADGTGEVSVNGVSHPVSSADIDQTRITVLRLVWSMIAVPLTRPVRVEIIEPDGERAVVVNPDGKVWAAPAEAPASAQDRAAPVDEQAPPQPAQAVSGQAAPQATPQATPEQPSTAERSRSGLSSETLDAPPLELVGGGTGTPSALGDLTSSGGSDSSEVIDLAAKVEAATKAAGKKDPRAEELVIRAPLRPKIPSAEPAPAVDPPERPRFNRAGVPSRPIMPERPAEDADSGGSVPEHPSEHHRNEAEQMLGRHRSPTLDDLLASRPSAGPGPAQAGWQATVRRLSGGLLKLPPGTAEIEHRAAIETVQRSLDGPKTIVVVNPKGGANKTTSALLIAATFGIHRGGYTLAWDNNETRGTLGWRANPAQHTNTAVDLLRDLDRFAGTSSARVGDLDNYVRSQGSALFDVLASDEDAAGAASIDADAFNRLHQTLSRFYRIMLIDTGNNMRASNWQAAVAVADQLVVVSTVREDTAQSAAWLVDGLRGIVGDEVIRNTVTVLTAPTQRPDQGLSERLHDHFGQLTRQVLDVPYDPALVSGGPVDYDALSDETRSAWLQVSAAIALGL